MTDQMQAQVGGGGGGGPRLPDGAQNSATTLREHAASVVSGAGQLQDEANENLLAQLEQAVVSFNGSVVALANLLQGFGGDVERQAIRTQQLAAELAVQLASLKEDHSSDKVSTWKSGAGSLEQEATTLESLITAAARAAAAQPEPSSGGGNQQGGGVTPEALQSVQLRHVEAPKNREVPEWAERAYRAQAKRKLICSMTLDGEIGSVYFGADLEGAEDLEGGRIRLTHVHGPEESVHPHLERVQFNVDMVRAKEVYEQEGDGKFSAWLGEYLNANRGNPPDWAGREILLPEQAPTAVSGRLKLFEIFVDQGNNVRIRHESRGEAVRYDTDKQTVAVLRAAIEHVQGMDPDEANEEFYDFVKKLLPSSDIVDRMRKPEDI